MKANYNTDKPLQRISQKEKLKKGTDGHSDWIAKNADFFISRSNFDTDDTKAATIHDNYNYYNNIIDEEKFHYVTNPLNSTKDSHASFPARIRPYNIIRPNMDLYMGEFIKRVFTFTVLNLDTDAYNTYEEKKKEALYNNIYQRYLNELNELGVETGEESKEVELPEEIEEAFKVKYSDIKAIKGQQKLNRIEREKDLFIEFKKLFKDYIIAGECISYKGIERGDIEYKRISPLSFRYGISPEKTFIEDSDWSVYRRLMTPSEVIDKFYDELKEEHHKYLESNTSFDTFNRDEFYDRLAGNTDDEETELVTVYHVVWTTQKKVGTYTFIDELGQQSQEQVEETFKLSEEDKLMGNTVKWYWVNEKWETYRISDEFYLRGRPIVGQRNALNNFSVCKSPYNGVSFSDTHSVNISPVGLGIPYQTMFIIMNFYIEKTIAKNKGKILMIDKNTIPNEEGWDEETFFYYSEAMGYALINRDQIGVDKSFNQYQVLDMSTFAEISQLIGVKDNIKDDYDELLGITRQRKGQVQASDSVGGTQTATLQSSLISELMFSNFDDFRRSDYQGLMDLTKFTTVQGEKGLFINDDLTQEVYNIEPGEFADVEMGVYVSNNPVDIQNLNAYKQFAQAFAQNGQSPSTVLSIIRSQNVQSLDAKLRQVEDMQRKQIEAQSGSEQEAAMAMKQLEKEMIEFKATLDMTAQEADHDRLDQREIIKGDIELGVANITSEQEPDDTINDIEKRALDRDKLYTEQAKEDNASSLKREELKLKKEEMVTKANTEKYKADTSLKIAKENKNKFDK
jgi:hypothetical protein